MKLYDIYSFLEFLKILEFINAFLKISVFRNFGGYKLKISKFRGRFQEVIKVEAFDATSTCITSLGCIERLDLYNFLKTTSMCRLKIRISIKA